MTEIATRTRLLLVDAARGVGLLMMAVYHGAWDLSWFGYLHVDVGSDPTWKLFAWVTAGVFLLLVGIGMTLASHAGMSRRRWLRRMMMVTGAALLISIVTLWLFPRSWIFFGILHHIALASVLALPFVRLPVSLTLSLAAVVLAAPALVALPLFDTPALQWVGLGTVVPDSNDYVPLLPWFGVVLTGIAAGRLLLASPRALAFAARPMPARGWRWLRLAGRHSLLVYLLHQPLLYGAVAGLAWLSPPGQAPLTDGELMQICVRGCVNVGGTVTGCELRCACAERILQPERLWAPAMVGALDPQQQRRAQTALQSCPPA